MTTPGGCPAWWTAVRSAPWPGRPAPTLSSSPATRDRPRLSGRLGPVEGASVADVAVVIVPDAVFVVDLTVTGRPRAEPAMDVTRTLSWLVLDDTPAVRIGDADASARLSGLGAVAASAELLGGAERVLELASEYAKDRIQFGVPIGSFQAVKHRCADMLVDVEGMRSVTWYAAWALSTGEPGWPLAASTAKVWCAEASKRVMASGLQVHGGIGFTWEHDLHLYLKRAQFSQLDYGDAAHHRSSLAAGLGRRWRPEPACCERGPVTPPARRRGARTGAGGSAGRAARPRCSGATPPILTIGGPARRQVRRAHRGRHAEYHRICCRWANLFLARNVERCSAARGRAARQHPRVPVRLGGAALAGATVVGVNHTRRGEQLLHDIRHTDCGLRGLRAPPRRAAGAGQVDELDDVLVVGSSLDDAPWTKWATTTRTPRPVSTPRGRSSSPAARRRHPRRWSAPSAGS